MSDNIPGLVLPLFPCLFFNSYLLRPTTTTSGDQAKEIAFALRLEQRKQKILAALSVASEQKAEVDTLLDQIKRKKLETRPAARTITAADGKDGRDASCIKPSSIGLMKQPEVQSFANDAQEGSSRCFSSSTLNAVLMQSKSTDTTASVVAEPVLPLAAARDRFQQFVSACNSSAHSENVAVSLDDLMKLPRPSDTSPPSCTCGTSSTRSCSSSSSNSSSSSSSSSSNRLVTTTTTVASGAASVDDLTSIFKNSTTCGACSSSGSSLLTGGADDDGEDPSSTRKAKAKRHKKNDKETRDFAFEGRLDDAVWLSSCSIACGVVGRTCLGNFTISEIAAAKEQFWGGSATSETYPSAQQRNSLIKAKFESATFIRPDHVGDGSHGKFQFPFFNRSGSTQMVCENAAIVILGIVREPAKKTAQWTENRRLAVLRHQPGYDPSSVDAAGGSGTQSTSLSRSPMTDRVRVWLEFVAGTGQQGDKAVGPGLENKIILPAHSPKQLHQLYNASELMDGIPPSDIAGLRTFTNFWATKEASEKYSLLTSKGSFPTCEICNHA